MTEDRLGGVVEKGAATAMFGRRFQGVEPTILG
jgi:hypothetical protein